MHNLNAPAVHGRGLVCAALVWLALGSAVAAAPAGAQEPARVGVARVLMEAGAFGAAEDSLRVQLRLDPRDATAHWLLGRVLYWTGRGPEALDRYRTAASLRPDDPWLRIEYAEVLMSLDERRRARETLETLLGEPGSPEAEPRALALLGTLAYWEGDYSRAVRRFEAALERDPGHADARAQLDEIRAVTRPWMRTALELLDDTQPYRRYRGTVEGGVYATPLWALSAGVAPRVLETDVVERAVAVWAGADGYLPALRLGVTGRLGGWVVPDHDPAAAPWTGTGGLGVRLANGLSVHAEASRRRYLATRASADTLLMVDRLELRLDRVDGPGWAGEAVVRGERFPDGNVVRTAYAWLLAPVLPALRAGYSASWQDADESRWTPTPMAGSPDDGRYDPYFTPEQNRIHAVLGELLLRGDAAELRIDGSYGFHALELAPAPSTSGPGPPGTSIQFVERAYSPWRVRAEGVLSLSDALTLRLAAERERTTFYQLDHATLAVHYTAPLPAIRP